MSKDFDDDRRKAHEYRVSGLGDRSFVLSGHTFHWLPNVSYTILETIATASDGDGGALFRAYEGAIIDLVEPEERDDLLAVLHSKEDPYSFTDLNAIVNWLMEEQLRRPTQAPSSSTHGDANPPIETSSKDDSSSPLVEVSTG